MKNRTDTRLTYDLLYAIERRARLERSKEMGRAFVLVAKKIAGLFRFSQQQHQSRKEALHA